MNEHFKNLVQKSAVRIAAELRTAAGLSTQYGRPGDYAISTFPTIHPSVTNPTFALCPSFSFYLKSNK